MIRSQPPYLARFGDLATWNLPEAVHAAKSGCQDMINATRSAVGAAHDAITALDQSAENARARRITSANIDPLTAVSLAYTDPTVLSPTALALGSADIGALTAADRAEFEKLLAGAQSPTEAAYLWKALSAGYTTADITTFDGTIHPFGSDPAWLTKHLEPAIGDPNTTPNAASRGLLNYGGVAWVPTGPGSKFGRYFYDEGNYGDCVAASTVVASLRMDPVRMLGVTTGRGPAAVSGGQAGDDSTDAVHSRLQNLYLQHYYAGQTADGVAVPNNTNGIGLNGQLSLDSQLLAPATGSQYQIDLLNDTAARASALPDVQAAAAAGKPVPVDVLGNQTTFDQSVLRHQVDVQTETVAHQMVIVGASGDELEVYNPWGYTQWVTDQQFVDGQMGALTSGDGSTDGGMPTPYEVQMPRSTG